MGFDWPPSVRECAWGDEPEAAAKLYADHARAWAPYRSAQRFIRDHYGLEWERVQQCRRVWRRQDHDGGEPRARVLALPCRCKPFCAGCNGDANFTRKLAAFTALKTGTPKGEHIRTFHVTIVKPGYRGRGGWGPFIQQDHRRFMVAAYRALERMYGPGVGAVMSYQEYGEALFTDLRPHVHAVVSGYRIEEGRVRETPRFDLGSGGVDNLRAWIIEELHRAYPQAPPIPREEEWEPRSIHLEEGYGGDEGQKKALSYNTRELIDPRKWLYRPGSSELEISDYHNPHKRTPIPIPLFRIKLLEYAHRIEGGGYDERGAWTWGAKGGRRSVDAVFGDFADRRIGRTFKLMGHKHGAACFCRRCAKKRTAWGRVHGAELVNLDLMNPDRWAW